MVLLQNCLRVKIYYLQIKTLLSFMMISPEYVKLVVMKAS